MSIFDQPVNSEMGCSLIDICSISVPFLPNCIVKPFISFTPSVSGTTLSVPSVYFISICIYFIDVPHVYIFSCYVCFICKKGILFFRCECGNCSSMTTPEECICCVEVPAVHSQMLSEDMQCITDSDIFISNCLNRHVLHVSMYEFLENVGPFDDEPINEYVIIFQHFIQYVHFSVKCA